MSEVKPDKRAVACNFTEGTKAVSEGALAYWVRSWSGGGDERIAVLAKSRGGRWIQIWEPITRLDNFRFKTIPPEHPRYDDERMVFDRTEQHLEDIQWSKECWRTGKWIRVPRAGKPCQK